jgi:hypothetical protein
MNNNLTVKWFKVNDPMSATGPEMIPDNHSDYNFSRRELNSTRTCIEGPLYRDTFSLNILNFTSDKNGYYWYQLFINGSSYQPSQYAWFYADYDIHMQTQGHFKYAVGDEIQCANATYRITSSPAMTTTDPMSDITSTVAPTKTDTDSNPIYANTTYIAIRPQAMTSTFLINITMDLMSTVAPKMTKTGSNPIYYVIGALTVLVVICGTLAIIILLMYVRIRHKEHRKKNSEALHNNSIVLDG